MFELNEVFGRINDEGNVVVLTSDDGTPVTKLNANVYPVGSSMGAKYDHPEGITITLNDAQRLNIEIEN